MIVKVILIMKCNCIKSLSYVNRFFKHSKLILGTRIGAHCTVLGPRSYWDGGLNSSTFPMDLHLPLKSSLLYHYFHSLCISLETNHPQERRTDHNSEQRGKREMIYCR